MNSTHCPNCNQDIGTWAIYKAGLPNLLKCPHCKVKLRYRPVGWLMLFISCLISAPFIVLSAYYVLTQLEVSSVFRYVFYVISIIIIWSPFEWYMVKKLRTKHELTLHEN